MTEDAISKAPLKHELKDANVRVVAFTGLGLYVTVLIACLIVGGVFHLFARWQATSAPLPSPMFSSNRQPPKPRLQTNPSRDLERFRAVEDEILFSYGWVDKKAGIAHIPIDRAMQLLSERNQVEENTK